MRREPYPIEGGTPGLMLVSETDADRQLTLFERKVSESALQGSCEPSRVVWKQLSAAQVKLRNFTGYGAYVEFEAFPASMEADPFLTENGFAESSIKAPWREQALYCQFLLNRGGVIGKLEFFPIDGEHWSVQEMERVLFGSLEGLVIEPR